MSDEFEGFFGEEKPKIKNAEIMEMVDNPILYSDSEATVNVLIADYLSPSQISYIKKLAEKVGVKVRVIYVFPYVTEEKHMKKGIARYFVENVRKDLKSFFVKGAVVTIGRALYSATYDTDVQVSAFYDEIFNNNFFYSPFLCNRVYPIDNAFRLFGFGQPDKKTGEPIYFYDRFETEFAKRQLKRAHLAGNCSLGRVPIVEHIEIKEANDWLLSNINNSGEEKWVSFDIETSGFSRLSDRIGNITLAFDGFKAYFIEWRNINPRILSQFLNSYKLVLANGKFDLLFLAYHGCDIHKIDWDTMVAGHFLNEMRSNSLKSHAFWYTNYGGYDLDLEVYKWKYRGLTDYTTIPKNVIMPYACMDAAITFQVFEAQKRDMAKDPELLSYYLETAVPMINVFIKAEYKGFCINWDSIEKTGIFLKEKIKECSEKIRSVYNAPTLDVNSKQSVAKMLEEKGYPCVSRGKLGFFNISKDELNEWKKMGYDEVDTLLEYSKWVSIFNTFIGKDTDTEEDLEEDSFFEEVSHKAVFSGDASGLWKYKAVDGNVHTTFQPFMTVSHRHSSNSPNLQNIPKKNYETTKLVRTAYVTPDTIPCKPEEADKIILLTKNKGYVSLLSGETIFIEGIGVVSGNRIKDFNLEELGIRVEYEKFFDTNFENGSESYLEIEDTELGRAIIPVYKDSSKKEEVLYKVIRNGEEKVVTALELKENDSFLGNSVEDRVL